VTPDSFADAYFQVERNLSDLKRDIAAVEMRLGLIETQLTASSQAIERIRSRFPAAGR